MKVKKEVAHNLNDNKDLIEIVKLKIHVVTELAKHTSRILEEACNHNTKLKNYTDNLLFSRNDYEKTNTEIKSLIQTQINISNSISALNLQQENFDQKSLLFINMIKDEIQEIYKKLNEFRNNLEDFNTEITKLADIPEANLAAIRNNQIKEIQELMKDKLKHCKELQKIVQQSPETYGNIESKINLFIEKLQKYNIEKLYSENIENQPLKELNSFFHEARFTANNLDAIHKKIKESVLLENYINIKLKGTLSKDELNSLNPQILAKALPILKDKDYDESKDTKAIHREKREIQRISFDFFKPNKEARIASLALNLDSTEETPETLQVNNDGRIKENLNKLSKTPNTDKEVQQDMESLDNVAKSFGNN